MEKKILANDGISAAGKARMEAAGFEVETESVPQELLAKAINERGFSALLVRSASKVRQDLIDACPNLKLIGRGGVGMDNIDVAYARGKGLHVINTPASSAVSVAELAMGAMFSMARYLYDGDRQMPVKGNTEFKALKKAYSKGTELRGKTLGIIGFGSIGQELAKYALGCGMNVISCTESTHSTLGVTLDIAGQKLIVPIKLVSMDALLAASDYISLHVPKQPGGRSILDAPELAKAKQGVCIVNTSRGGIVNEDALIDALNRGHVRAAFLDVFNNEPAPREDLLKHPSIISMPHIGGSTLEAQDRIGVELAEQVVRILAS